LLSEKGKRRCLHGWFEGFESFYRYIHQSDLGQWMSRPQAIEQCWKLRTPHQGDLLLGGMYRRRI